jgi:hypothetical protein
MMIMHVTTTISQQVSFLSMALSLNKKLRKDQSIQQRDYDHNHCPSPACFVHQKSSVITFVSSWKSTGFPLPFAIHGQHSR